MEMVRRESEEERLLVIEEEEKKRINQFAEVAVIDSFHFTHLQNCSLPLNVHFPPL